MGFHTRRGSNVRKPAQNPPQKPLSYAKEKQQAFLALDIQVKNLVRYGVDPENIVDHVQAVAEKAR